MSKTITRLGVGLAVGAAVLVGATGLADAAPKEPTPVQVCQDPEAQEFLASTGGCVSSVASIGLEALMSGAFPSRAAAVANCRAIAADVGGFPYYFYGNVGMDQYLATNFNTCVDVLYGLHTGAIPPGPQGG